MPEPCRSCACKEVDFGGCRCQAFALTGDAGATDPACALSPLHARVFATAEAEAAAPRDRFVYRNFSGGTPEGERVSPDDAPPAAETWLDVGDGHEIRVETWGDPAGAPVLFLHGGPGSGCQPNHRALFDPGRVRAVFVDQRGAGRSRPKGERRANSTAHLVADLEAVRTHLGIERWLVTGGSWGATLALAYAQAHPARVAALALRAVFLGTRAELDWAFGATLATFHPDLHADFLGFLPPEERGAPLEAYWRRILDPDPAVHGPAAWAWYDVERALSELRPARRSGSRRGPRARRFRPRPSWKRITSSTTAFSNPTSCCATREGSRTSPASSCRDATTCCVRPRPRPRSRRPGRRRGSRRSRAPATRSTSRACGRRCAARSRHSSAEARTGDATPPNHGPTRLDSDPRDDADKPDVDARLNCYSCDDPDPAP